MSSLSLELLLMSSELLMPLELLISLEPCVRVWGQGVWDERDEGHINEQVYKIIIKMII